MDLVVRLVSTVDKILAHSASRGPSAVAELPVTLATSTFAERLPATSDDADQ